LRNLITRNGHDWAARYPLIVAAVDALWARSCIIDGELAKCDERGLAVFDLLRTGPRAKTDVALFAFDLLELNGEDLRCKNDEEHITRDGPDHVCAIVGVVAPHDRKSIWPQAQYKEPRPVCPDDRGSMFTALHTVPTVRF
jgi:hypothetical protein